MRIGTKILLLMLLITIGSAATVSWIVTRTVTRYETDRANDEISLAISRYIRHLDEHYQQVNRVVQVMLGDPTMRSLLAATDDSGDASAAESVRAAKSQLKEEVFGRDVQAELTTVAGPPAFHVLTNLAREIVLVSLP